LTENVSKKQKYGFGALVAHLLAGIFTGSPLSQADSHLKHPVPEGYPRAGIALQSKHWVLGPTSAPTPESVHSLV
jgi:hypothetical protein